MSSILSYGDHGDALILPCHLQVQMPCEALLPLSQRGEKVLQRARNTLKVSQHTTS